MFSDARGPRETFLRLFALICYERLFLSGVQFAKRFLSFRKPLVKRQRERWCSVNP